MKKMHTLVVGGTRGIGKALVRLLANKRNLVSVIARNHPNQGKAVKGATYWKLDITKVDAFKKMLPRIIRKNGKLNNLVFFQKYRGDEDWKGEIMLSLTATKNIIEITPTFFVDEGGSIVIMSSSVGHLISYDQPLGYHVGKAGINQMARYYAVKLGHKGIRVNSVSPCAVLKEETKEFYQKNKNLYNLYKDIAPLGRMGTSEDIANVIMFLCSPAGSFITGQNIIVDGGISIIGQEALGRKLMSQTDTKRK